MFGRILLLCLIGFGLIAPAANAVEPPCVMSDDHPLIGEPRWYGLYYDNGKIGHAMTSMTFEESSVVGDSSSVIVQRLSMTFKLEQTEETIEQVRRFERRPPHRLLRGMYKTADRHITYQQQDGDLHLHEDGISRVWTGIARNLCDEEDVAVHQFLADNPPIGAHLETADFDVEQQVLATSSHDLEEVSNRKILGADHVFQTLRTESISDVFSYVAKTRFQNGEAVNLFLGPIELRAETEAIAYQPNQGVDLFAEFEKPLNRPLSELSTIETLTLRARIDDPAVTIDEVVTDGFGQRVDYLDDKSAIIRIAEYTAPSEDIDLATYLRPTSSHPADHPRLKAIVSEIRDKVGPNPEDIVLAKAILDFVADYIETVPESPYSYHTSSVFDILDNRIGDCTEHSQLFVTLARAAGVPAREVSGFVYGGDDRNPSLGGHAWVEAFIDGRWIGMDPTWKEVRLNKSHVQTRSTLVPSLAFEVLDISYR